MNDWRYGIGLAKAFGSIGAICLALYTCDYYEKLDWHDEKRDLADAPEIVTPICADYDGRLNRLRGKMTPATRQELLDWMGGRYIFVDTDGVLRWNDAFFATFKRNYGDTVFSYTIKLAQGTLFTEPGIFERQLDRWGIAPEQIGLTWNIVRSVRYDGGKWSDVPFRLDCPVVEILLMEPNADRILQTLPNKPLVRWRLR